MLFRSVYDGFNKLISFADADNTETIYSYKPSGLRYSKTTDDVTTIHLWDGNNIIAEANEEIDFTALYVRGIGLLAVETADEYGTTTRKTYLNNAHGDVVQLTDDLGQVLWYYDYDAFGNELNPNENDTNPFRYCGEYSDDESETIYLRARTYDPGIGRFTQQDDWGYASTTDPLSLNLYTYCANNPVGFVDPSGHEYRWERVNPFRPIIGAVVVGVAQAMCTSVLSMGDFLTTAAYLTAVMEEIGDLSSFLTNLGYDAKGLFFIGRLVEIATMICWIAEITDDELSYDLRGDKESGLFVLKVEISKKTNNPEHPKGTELVRNIIGCNIPVAALIAYDCDYYPNSFWPTSFEYVGLKEGGGYGPKKIPGNFIVLDPGQDFGNGGGTSDWPMYLVFAHELIHVNQFIKFGPETYTAFCEASIMYTDLEGNRREADMIEILCVGFSASPSSITENSIRAEHGLSLRKWY